MFASFKLSWPSWVAPNLAIAMAILTMSCTQVSEQSPPIGQAKSQDSVKESSRPAGDAFDPFIKERHKMVATQLAKRDIVNQRVLDCMRRVPRHQFVPASRQIIRLRVRRFTVADWQGPDDLQPYIVAHYSAGCQPHHKAPDIGTGSGYQAAVLAELVKKCPQHRNRRVAGDRCSRTTREMDYNIIVRHGDGYRGWESELAVRHHHRRGGPGPYSPAYSSNSSPREAKW